MFATAAQKRIRGVDYYITINYYESSLKICHEIQTTSEKTIRLILSFFVSFIASAGD